MGRLDMLREFFTRLDAFLETLPSPERGCGDCRSCCQGFFFHITRLEHELMVEERRRRALPVITRFHVAARPEDDPRVLREDELCPFHAQGEGCSVYAARPLPCRLYGKYIPATSVHFAHCVYRDPARYACVEEIPLWSEYAEIIRRHPSPPGYFALLDRL